MPNNQKLDDKNSIYECSSQLENKGYMYTNDGLYCPLVDTYYLEISRTTKKYSYSLVDYKNSIFNHISENYTCKESITEHKKVRTDKINEYWDNSI